MPPLERLLEKKGSKTRSRASAGMPLPLSVTVMATRSLPTRRVSTSTSTFALPDSTALRTRFTSTCSISTSFARISRGPAAQRSRTTAPCSFA